MVRPENSGKQYCRVFLDQLFLFNLYLFLAILFLMSATASFAGNKTHAGDKLISLTAKNEPLGDVLNKISLATGYKIDLDYDWRNYPVSVSLEGVPLDRGLKRILRDFNNVIVYVSSKKIRIIIYDKISAEKASLAPSTKSAPISRQPSYRPYSPDNPDSQALGTDEAPPDNPAVSDEEPEAGVSDNDENQNTKLENSKTKTPKRPHTDLEDQSSNGRSEQNSQNESSSTEETERPQDTGNNPKNE